MIKLILNESLLLWAIVALTTFRSLIQIVEGIQKKEKEVRTHAGSYEIAAGIISFGIVLIAFIF